MARPNKQGLDYFPLDVGFMDDIKIRKIIRACGIQSIAVLISLLGNIYADNGYYLVWDSDMPFLIADKIGISEGAVHEIVNKALQVGFFDIDIFEKHQILTSRGIQSRFIEAISRRKEVILIQEYMIIDVHEKYINVNINWINVDNNSVNVDNNRINVDNNSQSKGKEIESKKKEKNAINSCSQEANDLFERLWAMYPRKRGKSQVSTTKKLEILKVGEEEMVRAIERYKREIRGVEDQFILNGSTFFHGRYKDYVGDNYVPTKMRTERQTGGQSFQDLLDEWEKS